MAKKVTPQKKVKKPAEKRLAKVPAEYVFWCHDGCIFADLYELAEGLKTMSDETFAYHSNLEKHDFSNWIRDIIGDEQLADDLARASCRSEAVICVDARITWLTGK
jgi:hypothetical protein